MTKVEQYLKEESMLTPVLLNRTIAKLKKHPDIFEEFEQWVDSREYKIDDAVNVEGYSAKNIADLAPFLDGLGVFNFLVTLRENPARGKDIIASGFPRK